MQIRIGQQHGRLLRRVLAAKLKAHRVRLARLRAHRHTCLCRAAVGGRHVVQPSRSIQHQLVVNKDSGSGACQRDQQTRLIARALPPPCCPARRLDGLRQFAVCPLDALAAAKRRQLDRARQQGCIQLRLGGKALPVQICPLLALQLADQRDGALRQVAEGRGDINPLNPRPGEYLKQKEDTVLSTARTNGNISENTAVVLASSGKTGTEVVAKLVEIEDGTNVGGYAYWVSDESTKAKINIVPGKQPTGSPSNFSLMTPQHFGFKDTSDWLNQSSWFDGSTTPDVSALSDVKALVGLGTLYQLNTEADKLMYDTTLHSYGVLSNSRDGGLKKDLTAGLGSSMDSSLAGKKIIPNDIIAANDTPLWDQLNSWVQATPSGTGSELKVQGATNTQAGIYPILLGFQLYLLPAYEVVTPSEYKLQSYVVPTVALWNPYNYPLETTDYKIVAGRIQKGGGPDYMADFAGHNGELAQAMLFLAATNAAGTTYNESSTDFDTTAKRRDLNALRGITNKVTGGNYDHNETLEFYIPSVSLAPGQIKIYTADQNQPYVVGSGNRRELIEGNNPFGFLLDLGGRTLNNDASSGTATPITKIKATQPYNGLTTRVGALQFSAVKPSGVEVLSDAIYLNHTVSASGNSYAGIDVQMVKGTNDDLIMRDVSGGNNIRAFGFLALRNMGIMPSAALVHHRESNQLDADLKWLAHYNPRAATSGPHPISYRATKANYDSSTTSNPSFISLSDHRGEGVDSVSSLVNDIYANSSNGIVLFEASPGIENIFTVGQLTHAPLFYWNGDSSNPLGIERARQRIDNGAFDNLIPANPIGNSRANPAIPLNATQRSMDFNPSESFQKFDKGNLYDYSYLLNQALWDDYFFSGVMSSGNNPETGQPIYGASRNPRIVMLPGITSVKRGLDTSAENLLIDGPFNVNSTSIPAWKALLTSFYGRTPGAPNAIAEPTNKTDPLTPFPRTLPAGVEATKINPGVNDRETYAGYNTLNEDQIDALAKAIVDEIRERGISTTLAAFINRKPSADNQEHQLQGILSAAIEKAKIGSSDAINNNLRTADQASSKWRKVTASNLQYDAAAEGYMTEGLPGWLTSADILARLGSVLTSRGDTFLVRAYGEYGTKNNLSKAWCEAVVQRLPEPVEKNQMNKFGRRYIIVGFRWLAPDEI